jgi:hypothetical protein
MSVYPFGIEAKLQVEVLTGADYDMWHLELTINECTKWSDVLKVFVNLPAGPRAQKEELDSASLYIALPDVLIIVIWSLWRSPLGARRDSARLGAAQRCTTPGAGSHSSRASREPEIRWSTRLYQFTHCRRAMSLCIWRAAGSAVSQ